MAEAILYNTVADVMTRLGTSAVQRTASVLGVGKELKKLRKKLDSLKAVMVDAERRQWESDAVKSWVRRLKDVVYAADDLLDDFEKVRRQQQQQQQQQPGVVLVGRQVSRFFSSSNHLVFCFKMSSRLTEIKQEVDEIVKEIPLLKLSQLGGNNIADHHRGLVESSWRETHSPVLMTSEMVERNEEKEEITEMLVSPSGNEKDLSAVAVIGIGGLGKTTIAQLVYNDKKVVEFFELRIWIRVSDDFDAKLLVRKALESLSTGTGVVECINPAEPLEVSKARLHEKLSQKRSLLVLDDVWNDDFQKWERLKTLLMVGATGSKILITTRNRNVASSMGIECFPFHLKGLQESQSWNLFSKIAYEGRQGQGRKHRRLVEIGRDIVNSCSGVPLIIKTLGGVLRNKTDENTWLSIKNNENLSLIFEGGRNDHRILAVLKLSYDDLPFLLKQCFVYCVLFPKDYEIEKNMLVKLWMAQGYIQASNVGNQYIEELLSRSLLEEAKRDVHNNISHCKMHDLVHDLAQSVVGSEVIVLEDNVEEIFESCHHVSFSSFRCIQGKKLKMGQLRTVLKFKGCVENCRIDDSTVVIPSFRRSRVLSLYGIRIEQVPKSISKLTHLRYLDLSFGDFELLPDAITTLYNLQTLELSHCQRLKELPRGIGKLINLRHLVNDGCTSLSHMSHGIGGLTSLESLPLFVVGTSGSSTIEVGRLSELKMLNNLGGELMIKRLENVRGFAKVDSVEANLGEKDYIEALILEWSYDDQQARSSHDDDDDYELVLLGLRPHQNLKMLSVEGYGGVRLPNWMMNNRLSTILPNLSKIALRRCSRCQILPSFMELPHLMYLELSGLEKVEHMEECSSEPPLIFFPSLKRLHLSNMPNLKELWRMRRSTTTPPLLTNPPSSSFPCLSKIEMSGCASLVSILLPPSPVLSELQIWGCDALASLELGSSPSVSAITIGCCPKLTSFSVPHSPVLACLEMSFCGDLASLEFHSSRPLNLHKLKIRKCPKLRSLKVSSLPCLKRLELDEVGGEETLQKLMWLTSATTSSSSSSSLELVSISRIDDLTTLPDELHQHASTLRALQIKNCSRLAALPRWIGNLTSLTALEIGNCCELTSLPQDMRLLGGLTSLGYLHIASCARLTSFPEEMVSLTALKTLKVYDCCDLSTLSNWIGSLSSLESLSIGKCPELTLLPEEMRSLTSLKKLVIFQCPQLQDRCKKETGEDWPKIAHVPQIVLH